MKPGSPSRPATSGAPRIAVVGGGAADDEALALAESVGRRLGTAGAVLICGGRSGVMAAAARGCREAGGLTLGILPGEDAAASPPNEWIDVPVFTGAGQGRNLAVVLSADAVIAVGGGWGTLSEIALARKHSRPVVVLGDWRLEVSGRALDDELVRVPTAGEAVAQALELAGGD